MVSWTPLNSDGTVRRIGRPLEPGQSGIPAEDANETPADRIERNNSVSQRALVCSERQP
jgi:hypothetical protein